VHDARSRAVARWYLNATVEPPFFASCPVESLANECIARLIAIEKTAIEQAGSFDELKLICSKVEALRVYQLAQGAGLDAITSRHSFGCERTAAWARRWLR
jgi:hypothetical protein